MENKFKRATKRITAVAATAALVSSSVFGASLSDYPRNFVSGDKFDGQVVIGDSADSAAATSVISDLKTDLAGGSKVKITAKKSSSGGDIISAVDNKQTLNYAETLESVAEELDDGSTDVLSDEDLDNNEYTQTLTLKNGALEYDIFDDLDETEARTGLVFEGDEAYATYVISFNDKIVDADGAGGTDTTFADLDGETMMIMGNEFTVTDIQETKLELIGGNNKISLGESDSSTVDVSGVSYEITVQSVSDDEVLLTVNGETLSIDEGDVEDVAGISIAVTDLVPSGRDSVKGYASLVVGGQKINFDGTTVEINDEKFTDIYEDYDIDIEFDAVATSFETLTITYKVDEFTSLKDGESLIDPLFGSFMLTYNGLNDVDYSEFKITSTKEEVKFSGMTNDKKDIPSEFKLTTDETEDAALYVGSDKKRIYHSGTDLTIDLVKEEDYATGVTEGSAAGTTDPVAATQTFTIAGTPADTNTLTATIDGTAVMVTLDAASAASVTTAAAALVSAINADDTVKGLVSADNVAGVVTITAKDAGADANSITTVAAAGGGGATNTAGGATMANGADFVADTGTATFDLDIDNSDVQGNMFFSYLAYDDTLLYEVDGIVKDDKEADFEDLFDKTTESSIVYNKVDDLDWNAAGPITDDATDSFIVDISKLGMAELYLENELLMDFQSVEDTSFEDDSDNRLRFSYYTDIDMDDLANEDDTFEVSINRATDFDADAIELSVASAANDFVFNTEIVEDSDFTVYVDHYGTKVTVDTDKKDSISIMVPDEEVEGMVDVNFGGAAPEVSTFTVDDSSADAKVKELEDDGYTVTTEKVTTSAIEFDITAPVMASEVSGMSDMIVVGGPAVNMVSAKLLGVAYPAMGEASGLTAGEAVVRYFSNSNSVLVYGWDAAGTTAAANKLNSGGLTGSSVDVK